MRAVFTDNLEAVQDVVRIILERDDIEVVEAKTQKEFVNPLGRGVRFDVLAKDQTGAFYNIEIQRDNRGASPKRVRFNLSAIDGNTMKSRDDWEKLAETWIIIITENGYLCKGKPYRTVNRYFDDDREPFDDKQHIRYVNAQRISDDPIGRLMADFNATDPDDVQLPSIAKRFRIFKTANIGDENVSEVMREIIEDLKKAITDDQREEWIAEGKAEGKVEGKAEGKAEARAQILGNLLAIYPAEALLSDPHFRPMNFTQTEIDAVAATGN